MMCKRLICLMVLLVAPQLVLAGPIPEVTPDILEFESIAVFPAARPVIDGDLSDWIASEAVWKYFAEQKNVLRGNWRGPEDASIMWSTMWDETFFYIAAVVWDDYYTQPPALMQNWRGDCVYIFLDADADGVRDNTFSFLQLPEDEDNPTGPLVPAIRPAGGTDVEQIILAIVEDPNLGEAGKVYEAAIPLAAMTGMAPEIGGAYKINVGKEEGNLSDDGNKFLCWTNQEPGTNGNQWPVTYIDQLVTLNTAEFPLPLDGGTDIARDAALSWKAGASAVSHDVYFGTDLNAVTAASINDPMDVLVSAGQAETAYALDGLLDFAQTYYWRVDEVNDASSDSPWTGHIWSFRIRNYVVVDDFESYNDTDNPIYDTWLDGYVNGTGSTVGNLTEPYTEQEIIHSGDQSMPISWDNFPAPYYAEAERQWADPQDWTADSVSELRLWVRGLEDNSAEPLYAGVIDAVGAEAIVVNSDAAAVQIEEWQEWAIPLSEFTDAGVDVAQTASMLIGIGNKAAPVSGFTGTAYVDDVRLYLP